MHFLSTLLYLIYLNNKLLFYMAVVKCLKIRMDVSLLYIRIYQSTSWPLLDFEFSVTVSFFLIDICAAPRTNTDAVLDLFGIGETPRCAWTQWFCCGFKLYCNFDKITLLGFVVDAREAGVDLTSK